MEPNPLLPAGYDIVWSLVLLAIIGLAVAALISLARSPRTGTPADSFRALWALAIIFLPLIGSLTWFFFGRQPTRAHSRS
ncbi:MULTISPECIES: PLD nuclease N-terminal domain-containing protein [Mycetocola]|uniref:PLD nuclease N-terminal domain-containing protein n=1 Tax=Mycetocola TaxID=76634 RepID=UPI0004C04CAF|nr:MULTISPECIES: PLD nuclease N-terminal domain-containing protein [Mycetocola]